MEIAILVGDYPFYSMQTPRVYFNNIGSICTDSLRHGNGLSAPLLLTRAAKSSAAKSSASKTRSMESRLYTEDSSVELGSVGCLYLHPLLPNGLQCIRVKYII